MAIQRVYTRSDYLSILDILEEYTHPSPHLTWRLSLLDSLFITKHQISAESSDVKLLFKLETKVGACDEHYVTFYLFCASSYMSHLLITRTQEISGKKNFFSKIIASWVCERIFLICKNFISPKWKLLWYELTEKQSPRQRLHVNVLLGDAIPGQQEWGKRECEAEKGGPLLHWPQLQKKTQLDLCSHKMSPDRPYGTTACWSSSLRERNEMNLPVGSLLMTLISQNLPHFCCATWPLWTSDGKFISHASQPRALWVCKSCHGFCYGGPCQPPAFPP